MKNVLLTLVACCLVIIPASVAGRKCYTCFSSPDMTTRKFRDIPIPIPIEACGEYPEGLLQTCHENYNVCHSILLDVDADNLEKIQVAVKICGNETTTAFCNALGTKSATLKGSCYTCDTDGCNSAASTALSLALLFFSAVIFKLFH